MATVASEFDEKGHGGAIPSAQAVENTNASVRRVCMPIGITSSCCSNAFWEKIDRSFANSCSGPLYGLSACLVGPFWLVGMASFIMMAGRWTFEPVGVNGTRPVFFGDTRISTLISILSSLAWILLPFAALIVLVYGESIEVVRNEPVRRGGSARLEELRAEQALLDADAAPRPWHQTRLRELRIEIARLESVRRAEAQRDPENRSTVVAQEVDATSTSQTWLAALATPLNRRNVPKVGLSHVSRGKLVVLVTLIQLCWVPVSFYYYWQKEPVASDVEIYMFNLPIVLFILAFLLYAGCLAGILVVGIVLMFCVILPTQVVLASLYICLDRARAQAIEEDVRQWFEYTLDITW